MQRITELVWGGTEQEKISEDQEQWRGQAWAFPRPPAGALMFAPGFILLKLGVTFLCTLDLLFRATFKLQTSHYHFLPCCLCHGEGDPLCWDQGL